MCGSSLVWQFDRPVMIAQCRSRLFDVIIICLLCRTLTKYDHRFGQDVFERKLLFNKYVHDLCNLHKTHISVLLSKIPAFALRGFDLLLKQSSFYYLNLFKNSHQSQIWMIIKTCTDDILKFSLLTCVLKVIEWCSGILKIG